MLHHEKLATPITSSTPDPRPLAALAATLGGILWIGYYAVWIVNGLLTSQAPTVGRNPLYIAVCALFVGALCAISLALGTLALTLRPRHKILGSVALGVAAIAFGGPLFGFFARVLSGETIGLPGGIGVLATCLAASLLGVAALRSGRLVRREGGLLLALGVATFPLVVLLGIIANLWLPTWETDELPFAVAGAGWLVLGRWLRS
jgi:hypothetical protein